MRVDERFAIAFAHNAAGMVIVLARDRRMIEVNDQFLRLTGYTRDEVLGKSAAELGLVSPEVSREVAARGLPIRDFELELAHRDGVPRTALVTLDKIELDPEGTCLLCTFIDITARKHVERRLAVQLALTRLLAEAASLAAVAPRVLEVLCRDGWDVAVLWLVDPAGETLRCLDAWHRPDLPLAAFVAARRRTQVARGEGLLGSVLVSGEARSIDAAALRFAADEARAGGLRRAFALPIHNVGRVLGVIELLDRHARPLAPADHEFYTALGGKLGLYFERVRADHRVQAVIHALNEAVVIADASGKLLYWNPAAIRLHGYETDEALLSAFEEFAAIYELATIDGQPLPLELWPIARVLRGEQLHDIELRIRHLHRPWQRVFGYGGTLVTQADGSRICMVTITDITERVALQQQLEQRVAQRTAELAASNRDLEAFSSTVSHDLRAPLRAITGYTEAVLDDHGSKLPEDARRMLTTVRDRGLRMAALIDDLLALAQLGRAAMRPRTVELDALVRDVVDELTVRGGGAVEVDIGPLPACIGDPSLLRQVWFNLIENALKYSRDRDPIRIEIGGESRPGASVYFVRDNGIGFDRDQSSQLFVMFQRLHPVGAFEGSGIGLAHVRRIVERHGGRVWAESVPGAGATFWFSLTPA